MKSQQRGGFLVGLIVGLVVGLAVALGVALYVTKVPIPFVNKVPQRTPEQDAAELERNRNWDPNAPLYGKNPARPASTPDATGSPPATATAPTAPAPSRPATTTATAPATAPSAPKSTRDPAAILGDKPGADPFNYFVQAGAYNRQEEAEQQRARLGMLGFTAKITEREQSGRTVYRVRVGPFDKRDDADVTKDRLASNGVESALVRVQK